MDASFVCGALDGMCAGLVLTNASGRVTWANRSSQAMLGFDAADALGRPLSLVLRDPAIASFWHEASSGDGIRLAEVEIRWPAHRQLKVDASACFDSGGNLLGRALLFCDVSAERNLSVEMSEEAARRLLQLADGAREPVPHRGLTQQELRVLALVGHGMANKEIARTMHVAPSTVRSHLKHLYAKLGVESRAEAIRYALKQGLA
ncbi:MAG: hypothetical protein Fur0037_04390 [Planctomycetota bacterium]